MDELDMLQEEIAKARGWKQLGRWSIGELWGYAPDCLDAPGGPETSEVPDWPRDIRAAMELWDEMRADEACENSGLDWFRSEKEEWWECKASGYWLDDEGGGSWGMCIFQAASTPEEAICSAWLEWRNNGH